jgi:HSP20 family molecular chaperone IbpA
MNTETTKVPQRRDQTPEKLAQRAAVAPAVDIFESKDELLILADLPGVAKEDLSVHFEKGRLSIEGRLRGFAADEEPFDYRRSFVVPQGIDADKIAANLQNGVLRLSLPKPAAAKPRQIEIKSA